MKRLVGVAIGLIVVGTISALFALRSDGGAVLACDASVGVDHQTKAQAIFTNWQAAAEALSSYRLVTDIKTLEGRVASTTHFDMYTDETTKRSIGTQV